MKIIEVIDTDLSLKEIHVVIGFGPSDHDQSDVILNFEWEWNGEENNKIVTNRWVEEIQFNENQGNKTDIHNFADANITKKYIETLINE